MKKIRYLMFFLLVVTFSTTNAQIEPECEGTVLTEIFVDIDGCEARLYGKDWAGPGNQNPNAIWKFYVNNALVYTTDGLEGEYTFVAPTPGGTYDFGLEISVPVPGGYCSDRDDMLNVSLSCPEPDCCDLDPDFSLGLGTCYEKNFIGTNNGTDCPSHIYRWKVDGTLVGTSQNLSYTFPSDGTYEVCFTIINDDGTVKGCSATYCETIEIDCSGGGGSGNCPPATCLDIVEAEPCEDYQGWMNCNDPDIEYIDWYYSIGPHYHQYFHTSTGNIAGQHSAPLELPNPPSTGSWDNYNLIMYAKVYFENSECDEIYTVRTLSCSSGGGGSKVALFPNPTKANFSIQNTSDRKITDVRILNIQGVEVLTKTSNFSQEFNMSSQKPGVYMVNVEFADGTSEIKRLILDK